MDEETLFNQDMIARLSTETDDDSDGYGGFRPGTVVKLRALRFAPPRDRMVLKD
jgi:hypothetical protein